MTIIDILLASHERQREILKRCVISPTAFEDFRHELLMHIQDEEAILFPMLLELKLMEKEIKDAWKDRPVTIYEAEKVFNDCMTVITEGGIPQSLLK